MQTSIYYVVTVITPEYWTVKSPSVMPSIRSLSTTIEAFQMSRCVFVGLLIGGEWQTITRQGATYLRPAQLCTRFVSSNSVMRFFSSKLQ